MVQAPTTLQRKERERLARRQEILAAARKVFAERGYEHATLDEIAEKAEFAKGTLYNYFDSKETLFSEIVAGMLDEMTKIAEEAVEGGGTVRDQFYRYALRMFDYYRTNDDLLRILINEIHRVQAHKELVAIIQRIHAIASILGGALKKEMSRKSIVREDPGELAHVFVGMIHNRAMRRSFTNPTLQQIDIEAEAAFLTRLFFDGVASS